METFRKLATLGVGMALLVGAKLLAIEFDPSKFEDLTFRFELTQRLSTSVNAMEMKGDHLYIADEQKGLVVVDISNKEKPAIQSEYSNGWYGKDIVLDGQRAYLACGSYGMREVDIADPAHLKEVDRYFLQGEFWASIAKNSKNIYLNRSQRLTVLGKYCGNADLIMRGCSYLALDSVQGQYGFERMVASEDHLFAASYNGGLMVFDLKKSKFKLVDASQGADIGNGMDVFVSKQGIFLADGDGGLLLYHLVMNIEKNRWMLALIGSVDVGGFARSVYVSGNTAYVGVDTQKVVLVSVANPTQMRVVGTLHAPDALYIKSIRTAQNYIYVGSGSGLFVYKTTIQSSQLPEYMKKLANRQLHVNGFFIHYGPGAFDWVYVSKDGSMVAKLQGLTPQGFFDWKMIEHYFDGVRVEVVLDRDQFRPGEEPVWKETKIHFGSLVDENAPSFVKDLASHTVRADGSLFNFGPQPFDWLYLSADMKLLAKLEGAESSTGYFVWGKVKEYLQSYRFSGEVLTLGDLKTSD